MKNTLLILLTVFLLNQINAQWNNDPANPLLVSNETNYQNGPQATSDGEGGAYILWLDDRITFGKKEVYGQHVDADGNDLWEEGGRLILTDTKDIEWFRFIRYASDGKMIIAWYAANDGIANSEDKLWVQELNDEGAKVWPSDLAISEESPTGSLSVGYFINVVIKRDALGFQACMMILTYGYDRIRMTRFSEEGSLMMALNGVEIGPLDIGNVSMTTDGGTGAYVYYSTGNGLGAGFMCMRVDAYGEEQWEEWVSVAGPNGLSYQFSASGDEAGVTCLWQGGNGSNVEDLFARRLNPDGSFAWNGDAIPVIEHQGSQTNFTWIKRGDDYYIAWADGRAGLVGFYGIYAQKLNISGQTLWPADGVQVANLNTYGPYPRITYGTDDHLYVSHQSTVHGYVFQKLDLDGNVLWDAIGEQVANTEFAPSATDRIEFVSDNNLLAVWVKPIQSGGQDGIYINRVADFTPVTIIQQFETACGSYTYEDVVYDESGLYEIEIGQDSLLQLNLTINQSTNAQLDITACDLYVFNDVLYEESGIYTEVIDNAAGCDSTITLNLVIETVNVNVSLSNGTLTAEQADATYVWTDCETGEGVGEGSQFFTPEESGEYLVTINYGNCSGSSGCIEVVVIGTEEVESEFFSIYPNPASSQVMLVGKSPKTIDRVFIFDVSGRMVENLSVNNTVSFIPVAHLENGVYNLVIESDDAMISKTFIKQ
jgi:hypothetical protein